MCNCITFYYLSINVYSKVLIITVKFPIYYIYIYIYIYIYKV